MTLAADTLVIPVRHDKTVLGFAGGLPVVADVPDTFPLTTMEREPGSVSMLSGRNGAERRRSGKRLITC